MLFHPDPFSRFLKRVTKSILITFAFIIRSTPPVCVTTIAIKSRESTFSRIKVSSCQVSLKSLIQFSREGVAYKQIHTYTERELFLHGNVRLDAPSKSSRKQHTPNSNTFNTMSMGDRSQRPRYVVTIRYHVYPFIPKSLKIKSLSHSRWEEHLL